MVRFDNSVCYDMVLNNILNCPFYSTKNMDNTWCGLQYRKILNRFDLGDFYTWLG